MGVRPSPTAATPTSAPAATTTGFTTWLAGGGVTGGRVIGSTDEVGFRAQDDPVHVNDLHSTILRLLGIDHRKLTFLFQGREQRLTDVGGDHDIVGRLV